jgi:acyl-CoA synthetase (AMP-forming)/AMP-acid ligase II
MTRHQLDPSPSTTACVFSRDLPPVLTVDPGDTVVLRSLNASGHLRPQMFPGEKVPAMASKGRSGHCLTGPVAVRGAHEKFEERWGAPWRELYGSTESGLDLAVPPGAAQTVGTGAMGRPPPGKQVVIADEAGHPLPDGEVGEIVISGKPMMSGYWNHQDSTERAFQGGWYHSGDLGYRDAAGWIHHAGRLKDIIRRGGENISAAEVENVLALHPAVSAVAVVPIPDEVFGEVPKAFVQLSPGHQASRRTAVSLADHLRGRLARFKIPAFVEFVETFPMTPSARIRKSQLLEHHRDQRTGAFDVTAS